MLATKQVYHMIKSIWS